MGVLNIGIEDDIKERAEALFGTMGLDLTSAFEIFLRDALSSGGVAYESAAGSTAKGNGIKSAFGCMRGEIWTSEDFDEPLEDFAEYV